MEFLKLLSDPSRLKICKFLQHCDTYVCEISEVLSLSQPTVSQHMRRFKALGLIRENREGQKICYSLNKEVFEANLLELRRLLETDIAKLPELGPEFAKWRRCQELPCSALGKCKEEE